MWGEDVCTIVYLCVCVYTHAHVCIVCVFVCVCTSDHVCICVRMCAFVCVHSHTYVHLCMCVFTWACVHSEARKVWLISHSITLHLVPLKEHLSLNLEPGWQPVTSSTVLGLQLCAWPGQAFHVGIADLNSGLPASCDGQSWLSTWPHLESNKTHEFCNQRV